MKCDRLNVRQSARAGLRAGGLATTIFMALAVSIAPAHAQQKVSDDRELKELDLNSWNCLDKPGGSARTPDGQERNRLKNRSMTELFQLQTESFDTAGFLRHVADFDGKTKNTRRKDLNPAQRPALGALEKQIVQVTGYLVLAYSGPPETTNCASVDFHDWHLELFEKPAEHPPQIGDPTPIICEITPRTQNAIYRDNIRIQELVAFFRKTDVTNEATGHKAQKVRVTGYLLWDDEHNGRADVGQTVQRIMPNKFHQPWRSTAWEIHPVLKIERADGAAPSRAVAPSVSPPTADASPAPSTPETTPTPEATPAATPPPAPTPTPQQVVTVLQPVRIKIPYGETTLPRGTQLRVLSRNAQTVTVDYMGRAYPIPITSTDLH